MAHIKRPKRPIKGTQYVVMFGSSAEQRTTVKRSEEVRLGVR